MAQLACIVLAAGLGTRMKSATAKVLHPLLGRPLCEYGVTLCRELNADRVLVVLGHQHQAVEAALARRFGEAGVGTFEVVLQEQQLGTGHAVLQAVPHLTGFDGRVLILYGDVPLLSAATLRRLLAAFEASETGSGTGSGTASATLAMVTTRPPDPTGYGRIVRDRVNGAAGRVLRVVEQKDATPDERAIDEVNAGIYCFAGSFLLREIGRLRAENAQRELYLTDLVAVASREAVVATVEAEATEVAGINDRAELAAAEAELRRRINRAHMSAGVTLRDPATTTIEASVEIERDSEIGAGVVLRGATRIGEGCVVDIGCVLCDCIVERGARLKPYCVASESRIGEGAQVGPFAHLRPGSELGAEVHVGNFVETKKARLGRGSKANHLSYLGDTEIGSRANIGAGTITCNYDGRLKHRTVIEEGAFIGSDTQLVAPVRVGSGAYVGSGTTVTRDVPAGALALSRVEQRNVEGWVERKKRGE